MESERINRTDGPQSYAVRDLLEDIARQIADLGSGIESLEGIADELVSGPAAGLRRDILMRLQLIDSFSQQIAALPALVRSLKSSVPKDLTVADPDARHAFSAARSAYQGATVSSQAETPGNVGDCELWNS